MPNYPSALITSYRLHKGQPLAFVHIYRTPENEFIGHLVPTVAGVAHGLREFQTLPANCAANVWHGYTVDGVELYAENTPAPRPPVVKGAYEVTDLLAPRGSIYRDDKCYYIAGLLRLHDVLGYRVECLG